MASTSPPQLDVLSAEQRDAALRVGRAWRELRRGASMGRLIEYFFGVGDDALEFGQMDTLDLLVQQTGWRMGDLADALRVDPSTATRAIQRLEKCGLATRCSSTDDKRVVFVSATESGHKRHAAAAERRHLLMTHIMDSFDQQEFQELSGYLDRFVGSLDTFVAQLNISDDL